MAINQVNTIAEEQNSFFLDNQSSILHTIETNDITVNGVNVIVNKPKKGDIMCITRYKENDVLLDADKQEVIWIDGLSINLKQLSPLYEAVGICVSVKGNKAMVRYKEMDVFYWAASERWELPNLSIMNDGAEHTLQIKLNGTVNTNPLILTAEDTTSRKAFVDKLNAWFLANDNNYSAELVELYTDLPAVDTTDTKDDSNYRNRIIVNGRLDNDSNRRVGIEEIGSGTRAIANHINSIDWYYKNNGFKESWTSNGMTGGCCRARYYDYSVSNKLPIIGQITSINIIPRKYFPKDHLPANLNDFTNNEYCQLLRDSFSSYDEYIESHMIKYPCGRGGIISQDISGKENTYKLADCTFLDNTTGKQEILYQAANYAASIDLNAPNLGKGNWWLPSAAEMVEMMRDITYGSSLWDTKPDIVNRVIAKLNSIDDSWYMLSSDNEIWTSSKYNNTKGIYFYSGIEGSLDLNNFSNGFITFPITIYEF